MPSVWIGQLVAESLGRGIDSQKETDLWLLQFQYSAAEQDQISKELISYCLMLVLCLQEIFIYIYIYIYVVTMLVVTDSLCGFVVKQMRYNLESAQYLW